MNDRKTQNDADGAFEEGLRQILSYGPITPGANTQTPAAPSNNRDDDTVQTRKYEQVANRIQTEQRALFWFKIMRPIAFLALVTMMAVFVYRIMTADP